MDYRMLFVDVSLFPTIHRWISLETNNPQPILEHKLWIAKNAFKSAIKLTKSILDSHSVLFSLFIMCHVKISHATQHKHREWATNENSINVGRPELRKYNQMLLTNSFRSSVDSHTIRDSIFFVLFLSFAFKTTSVEFQFSIR